MQNEKIKKIIPIVIILVLLGLGLLAYFLFFRSGGDEKRPNLPVSENNIPTNGDVSGNGTNNGENNGNNLGRFQPTLRLVYDTPVAGGVTFNKNGKDYTRFIERGKGNVYETEAKNIRPQRLTNNTIPQIYNAYWSKNGEQVVGQYLRNEEEIQTFVGTIKSKSQGEGELQTQFIAQNVSSIALSPTDNQIVYLSVNDAGSKIIRSNLSLSSKVEIFNSPLKDWLIDYPSTSNVSVTSKTSSKNEGLIQTVNSATGDEKVLLSKKKGLTTLLNNSGDKLMFSESFGREFSTFILNTITQSKTSARLQTLPEKCVWSLNNKNVIFCAVPEEIIDGEYPEDWYLGLKSFKDEMWKTNVETGETVYLSNLSNGAGEDIDAYKISLSQNEKFITFLNKNNLKLYTLQIEE
jgi:hypothetical protein